MATKETLTKTLELFEPDHTAVIFCPDPKLPQTLFWDMVDPMKNVKWCETIPDSKDNIIQAMEAWKGDQEVEWYLLNLERMSPYFEQLTNFVKFAELMIKVDKFAKKHHLKMIVSLAFPHAEFALIATQMLDSYLTQEHHPATIMLMTDQDPITLTPRTSKNNNETIEYQIDANGHLSEKNKKAINMTALTQVAIYRRWTYSALDYVLKAKGYVLTVFDWAYSYDEFIFRIRGINHEPMVGLFGLVYQSEDKVIEAYDMVTQENAFFTIKLDKDGKHDNKNEYYQFIDNFAKKVQKDAAYISMKSQDYKLWN